MTLVEVVVALSLLIMVMAGSYRIVVLAASMNKAQRNQYLATNIAKNRIERARNFRYQDLILLNESQVLVDNNGAPRSHGDFRRSTLVNTNHAPNLTSVEVTVEIRNMRTGLFDGIDEVISSLFTQY